MKSMKKDFQVVTRGLKALARKTEQMVKKVDKLQKAKAAPKRTVKAKTKTTKKAYPKKRVAKKAPAKRTYLKKRATKKAPAKRKAVVRKAKTTTATATAQILKIVKRFKRGVSVPALVKKSRFDDKKVRDVLSRTFAQGKVKRVGRGVYVAA